MEKEQKLLSEHLAAIDLRSTMVVSTIVLGTLGSVALIGVIVLQVRREARQNESLAEATSEALHESERRFRRVFEESPLGKLLAEAGSLRIVQANPAMCDMLGYDEYEMIGETMLSIAHVDDRDLLADAIGRATDPNHIIEVRYLARSGVVAWARVRLTG